MQRVQISWALRITVSTRKINGSFHAAPKTEYFLEVRSGNVMAIAAMVNEYASPTFQLLRREELDVRGLVLSSMCCRNRRGHSFFPVFSCLMKMDIIRSGHAVQDMHARMCLIPLCIKQLGLKTLLCSRKAATQRDCKTILWDVSNLHACVAAFAARDHHNFIVPELIFK